MWVLLYIGTGVSGGEEGARHGLSIMPGGSPAAWPYVKDIFQAEVFAKVEGKNDNPNYSATNGVLFDKIARHSSNIRQVKWRI